VTETDERGPGGCRARNKRNGALCAGRAILGLDRCRMHAGTTLARAKADGQVVMELHRWGLNSEEVRDPGHTLLQLMTQSAIRVEFYGSLLQQAYEAAERLRGSVDAVDVMDQVEGEGPTGLPGVDSQADRDRATQDLQRIFATGGVSTLIGYQYAADKAGGVFATGEAIRGLVQLEADERDRCAGMAVKAIAAGLAERQVRLAEQQGALVAELIRGVLSDLGIDPSSPQAMQVVSARLHAVAGGAA
jgi:hypothetical protein